MREESCQEVVYESFVTPDRFDAASRIGRLSDIIAQRWAITRQSFALSDEGSLAPSAMDAQRSATRTEASVTLHPSSSVAPVGGGHSQTLSAGKGFSLVEVILSLGIFAVGALAIVGLMSGLLLQSRETWQETRAAQIAQQILGDLRAGSAGNGLLVGQAVADAAGNIPLDKSGSYVIHYDDEGGSVGNSSGDAIFSADVSLEPVSARTGLCVVRVVVKTPPEATNALSFQFFSQIASPEMEKQP